MRDWLFRWITLVIWGRASFLYGCDPLFFAWDEIAGDSKGPFALNPPPQFVLQGQTLSSTGTPRLSRELQAGWKGKSPDVAAHSIPSRKTLQDSSQNGGEKYTLAPWLGFFPSNTPGHVRVFFFRSLHSISVPFLPLMNNGTRDDPGLFHGYVWWDAAFSTNAQLTRGSLTVPVLLQLQLDIWR